MRNSSSNVADQVITQAAPLTLKTGWTTVLRDKSLVTALLKLDQHWLLLMARNPDNSACNTLRSLVHIM